MANIPKFQKGQHYSGIVLTLLTIAANGDVSDSATTYTLTTVIDEIDLELSTNLEEITPMNATMENYVPIIDTLGFRLSILKVNNTSDPSPLDKLMFAGNKFFKLVYVEGTETGSIATNTLYGVVESLSSGGRGKGRQIASLSFRVIGHSTGPTRVVS